MIISASSLSAQHLYQQPKPIKHQSELEKIIGPVKTDSPSRELNIIWVYGYDEWHIAGAHDYVKVKDLMKGLLEKVKKVNVIDVFHFPDKEQFDEADIVVMFLHLPQLTDAQFSLLRNFVLDGGGVVSLHESAIMRPSDRGKKLSECIGSAWNEGTSKWGAIFEEININNQHPVFKGFPSRITITDEFYWDLFEENSIEVLGSVRTGPDGDSEAPVPKDQLSEDESPVMWIYEQGKGRVFGTTAGHHTFTYYDPEFRIMLFRAMAWAVNENPDPFMPLVFDGITNEKGMVGITEDLRYWEGKRRN